MDEDLSIIFQGPVVTGPGPGPSTLECIKRTRAAYPRAQIILSTWRADLDFENLVDQIIVSADPGPLDSERSLPNYLVNINRQIVSTRAGLGAAARKYAIKMRCDSYLERVDLERLRVEYGSSGKSGVFRSKILLSICGCVDPVSWPALFFVSDLFQFGYTSDLRALWAVPLCPAGYGNYHLSTGIAGWRIATGSGHVEKCAPEQYVWIEYLRMQGFTTNHYATVNFSIDLYVKSEECFYNNFTCFPSAMLGLVLPSRFSLLESRGGVVVRNDWLEIMGAAGRAGVWGARVRRRKALYVWSFVKCIVRYYLLCVVLPPYLVIKRWLTRVKAFARS